MCANYRANTFVPFNYRCIKFIEIDDEKDLFKICKMHSNLLLQHCRKIPMNIVAYFDTFMLIQ